jgi:hypothetical protein
MPAWYIDSWSILDGIAFASLREPWDDDATNLVPAQTTVMMAPPDWRAVSIARLSTALAATRRGFQDGVYDTQGEVAFPDLATIRTVVRRAYLAGGTGLDNSGNVEAGGPPDGDLPGDGEWLELRERLLDSSSEEAKQNARRTFVRLITNSTPQFWRAIGGFLETLEASTERAWSRSQGEDGFRNRRDAVAFARLNLELGLAHFPDRYYFYRYWSPGASIRDRLRLLLRLPVRKQFPEYPPVKTIADQVFLVSASRHCFKSLERTRDVLPLLLAGLVAVGAGGLVPGRFKGHDALALESAARWVSELVPERLQDTNGHELVEVEALLEDLIRRIAHWRNEGGVPTNTPHGPSGSGPTRSRARGTTSRRNVRHSHEEDAADHEASSGSS